MSPTLRKSEVLTVGVLNSALASAKTRLCPLSEFGSVDSVAILMASAPVTEQGSRADSSNTSSSDEMQVVSLTLAGKGVGMGGASLLNSVIQSPDAQTSVGRGNPRRRLCLARRGVGRGGTSGSVAQGGVGRGGISSPAMLRGVGRGASITVGVVAAAEIPSTDRNPDSERRPAPPLVEVKVRTDGSGWASSVSFLTVCGTAQSAVVTTTISRL